MRYITLALAATFVIGSTLTQSDLTELLKSDIISEKESLVRGAMVFESGTFKTRFTFDEQGIPLSMRTELQQGTVEKRRVE